MNFQHTSCIHSALHSYTNRSTNVQSLGTRKAYKLNEGIRNEVFISKRTQFEMMGWAVSSKHFIRLKHTGYFSAIPFLEFL
jgi:hypothetical protein